VTQKHLLHDEKLRSFFKDEYKKAEMSSKRYPGMLYTGKPMIRPEKIKTPLLKLLISNQEAELLERTKRTPASLLLAKRVITQFLLSKSKKSRL
jgi:hypothetical protein